MNNLSNTNSIQKLLAPCLLALLCGWGVGGEAPAPSEPKATDKAKEKKPVEAGDQKEDLDPADIKAVMPTKLTEHEGLVHKLLVEAFPGADGKGGRTYLKSRKLTSLSLREGIVRALEKNLTIQQQGKFNEISKEALEEAKAVFDPVFGISTTYNRFERFNRKESARRFREATEPFDLDGNGVIDPGEENVLVLDKSVQEEIGFFAFVFRDPRPAGFIRDTQQASQEGAEGPTYALTHNLSITQQLPWGNTVAIGYTVKRQMTHFLPGFRIISPDTREYNRPYKSDITVNVVAPLPFMKDFGRNASAETTIEQAKLNKERAFWDTKTVINSTLLTVDLAYWNVVGAIEGLRAATENRKLLEKQVNGLRERVKAGQATEYGLQLTLSQMAGVRTFEEAAWNVYERSSNTLVSLLDLDAKDVVFPAGYSQFGETEIPSAEEEVVTNGMQYRPEIKAEEASEGASEVLLAFAENQARPDLKMGVDLLFSQQLEQLFGYADYAESFKNTTRPDTISHKYTFAYTRAWGNRANEASHRQAARALVQQKLTLADTKNLVEQQLSDALIAYLTSRKQLNISKNSLEKAKTAFSNAQELYDAGRLTVFEQISKISDLLTADLTYVSSAIGFKQAEASLLAAQGIIASHYAERSSDGAALDTHRLKVLATAKAMQFFAPAKTAKTQDTAEDTAPKAEAQPVKTSSKGS